MKTVIITCPRVDEASAHYIMLYNAASRAVYCTRPTLCLVLESDPLAGKGSENRYIRFVPTAPHTPSHNRPAVARTIKCPLCGPFAVDNPFSGRCARREISHARGSDPFAIIVRAANKPV